jgi:hypothetical protein
MPDINAMLAFFFTFNFNILSMLSKQTTHDLLLDGVKKMPKSIIAQFSYICGFKSITYYSYTVNKFV